MKLRLNRFYDSHANEFLNASLKKMSSVESAQVHLYLILFGYSLPNYENAAYRKNNKFLAWRIRQKGNEILNFYL